MKKKILLFILLTTCLFSFAQVNRLREHLTKEREENQAKFDHILNKISFLNSLEKEKLKASLASVVNGIPFFWKSMDKNANQSSNISVLQTGNFNGFNENNLRGQGINILVIDEGRALVAHDEFNLGGLSRVTNKEADNIPVSPHSTKVSSILLGNGNGIGQTSIDPTISKSDAKGVLPDAAADVYSFKTTDLGTNFEKLNNFGFNISNHSYAINTGWDILDLASGAPELGLYWMSDYNPVDPNGAFWGSYGSQDRDFDDIVYSNPNQIIFKGAGNYSEIGPEQFSVLNFPKYKNIGNTWVKFSPTEILPKDNCSFNTSCLGWGSLSKNIIVVGATLQLTESNYIYTVPSNVVKWPNSSVGPRKDGAIKPDLVAVGDDILSGTYYPNIPNSNSEYAIGPGTSFSTPIIAGIAGLVTQIERIVTGNPSFIYRADEMKVLLIHTANEAGNIGPDISFGWGLADAKKAAQVILDKHQNQAIFERKKLISNVPQSLSVKAKGGEPLKVSISWIDPPAIPFTSNTDLKHNKTSRLINDLDLRIIDSMDNIIFYPWKLDINNPTSNVLKGDNTVDNVEQIVVDNPVAGKVYSIQISNKGILVNDQLTPSSQEYAIIVTGIQENTLSVEYPPKNGLVIYPAKTKDYINIININQRITIKLYDMNGRILIVDEAKGFKVMDVKNIPSGTYILRIESEKGENITKKIIKEN
ncbi:T9SS C-terminal target domain-containing protein [Chryseobacterium nematophagum]|uniref:T9SS C-terminal target domain-containing protein n=1 Tax=Chryseobacterium nematophagum TaxID=2305228 RepID=A0A3M7TF13_9FLAO|nr:S8 family peptidase [Chryseobacterium nematophagum]RNA61477.1 T9SS C-terminal target domain-containing protein [Chryseobacterium nematophagum]